jgi:hypothetical protein
MTFSMKMKFLRAMTLVLAGCLVVFAGCATAPKIDWNSRVGIYTFDDAVKDYGPPDKSATLADGTEVCEWLARRGYSRGFVHVTPGYGLHTYDTSPSPDQFLRLTFNKERKLTEWKILWR